MKAIAIGLISFGLLVLVENAQANYDMGYPNLILIACNVDDILDNSEGCVYFAMAVGEFWKTNSESDMIPRGRLTKFLRDNKYQREFCKTETPENAEARVGDANGVSRAQWAVLVQRAGTDPIMKCINSVQPDKK